MLAAGGAHKAPIIRGAIRAKLCHILITDEGGGDGGARCDAALGMTRDVYQARYGRRLHFTA